MVENLQTGGSRYRGTTPRRKPLTKPSAQQVEGAPTQALLVQTHRGGQAELLPTRPAAAMAAAPQPLTEGDVMEAGGSMLVSNDAWQEQAVAAGAAWTPGGSNGGDGDGGDDLTD